MNMRITLWRIMVGSECWKAREICIEKWHGTWCIGEGCECPILGVADRFFAIFVIVVIVIVGVCTSRKYRVTVV